MTTRRTLFSLCAIIISSCFLVLGNAQAVSLDGTPPTAPTNVTATVRTSPSLGIVISWSPSTDNIKVTRYNVYRNGSFFISPPGIGTTYTDTDVVAGQSYTYAIQAGDGDGNNGPQSDTILIVANSGATSQVTSPPQVPSDPSPTVSIPQVTTVYTNTSISDKTSQVTHPENIGMIAYDDRLQIMWKNPTGNQFKSVRVIKKATSYPVSIADGKVICDSMLEQCVDKEVIPNTMYYYGVYAVDQSYVASKLITVSGSLVEKKVPVITPPKNTQIGNTTPINIGTQLNGISTEKVLLFTKTLKVGSLGQEVLSLQKFLNTHGFVIATSGPGSSGNETVNFGRATEKALKAYQCSKKIVCDGDSVSTGYGMVGKTTRGYLNKN